MSVFFFDFLGFLGLFLEPPVELDALDFLALGFAPVDALFLALSFAMVEVRVGDGERRENL